MILAADADAVPAALLDAARERGSLGQRHRDFATYYFKVAAGERALHCDNLLDSARCMDELHIAAAATQVVYGLAVILSKHPRKAR